MPINNMTITLCFRYVVLIRRSNDYIVQYRRICRGRERDNSPLLDLYRSRRRVVTRSSIYSDRRQFIIPAIAHGIALVFWVGTHYIYTFGGVGGW